MDDIPCGEQRLDIAVTLNVCRVENERLKDHVKELEAVLRRVMAQIEDTGGSLSLAVCACDDYRKQMNEIRENMNRLALLLDTVLHEGLIHWRLDG